MASHASHETGGFHPLTDRQIDQDVTCKSPGTYALGYVDGGRFIVFYVGRSDSDVNERLHRWVGIDGTFTRYGPGSKAAYGSRQRHRAHPLGAAALLPVGGVADCRYTHFEFSYAASAQAAFEKECRNYHDFGGSSGLDNQRHPVAPEGAPWQCPVDDSHAR